MARAKKLPQGVQVIQGKYRLRLSYRGTQYSIGTFDTLGDAKAARAIARSEMARGVFIPPQQRRQEIRDAELQEAITAVTVEEWAEDWLQRLESVGKSPGTTRSYRSTLNVHVLPVLGDKRLMDVTREDVDALVSGVREARGPWQNVARTLRTMFRTAIAADVGGLTLSPVRVTVPKARMSDTIDPEQIASPAEVRAMTEAMPPDLQIAVPLAAWCALRQGEVLGLQRRDLEALDDPERATLHVRRQWHSKTTPPAYAPPKAGSARSIAIPPVLLPALSDHISRFAGPGREGPLLPSPRNAEVPISQTQFDRAWRAAREAAGRDGFRFHDLRHTGLTAYAQQGATQAELMRRGGHLNPDAAARYQHATVERDRALTARLNAALDGEGNEK